MTVAAQCACMDMGCHASPRQLQVVPQGPCSEATPKASCFPTTSELSWQVTTLYPILCTPAYLHMWWPVVNMEYPTLWRHRGTGTPSVLTGKWQRGHGTTQNDRAHQGCGDDFVRTASTRSLIMGVTTPWPQPCELPWKNARRTGSPAWARVGLRLGEALGCGAKWGESATRPPCLQEVG